MARRRRTLTPEEQALWTLVADTVTPLADRPTDPTRPDLLEPDFSEDGFAVPPAPAAVIPSAAPPAPPKRPPRKRDTGVQSVPPGPLPAPTPAPPPELAPGVTPGLDRRTANRLRRGRLTVDGRLDLHGMTQVEAHIALSAFVEASAARGRRCLLVITGKGTRGEGVLRRLVPRWLNDDPLRRHLLAIEAAQPEDGGSGALYILLKRKRETS